MNIVVDNLLTHYELNGKGKLLLFLHGWGDQLGGLKNLTQPLEAQYQVLAVDLPGFGDSEAPKGAWDLDNYADFLDKLLKKLDLGEPYAVIGHSNGGALAIRALSLKKLSTDKLVLLAASGVRDSQPMRRAALKTVAKTGKVATFWLPSKKRKQLRAQLYGVAGSDLLVVPGMEETFKKSVRQDVQNDAKKLNLPTMLIYARDDRAVPLEDGERYHSLIKDSKLEVVDDAAHFVHQDQPEQVLDLVKGFLKP